jgi:Fe-S-cluster containining protein
MSHLRNTVAQPAVHTSELRQFLTALEAHPPPHLDTYAQQLDQEVWQETDCMACANCCRTMSPTYTAADIKRLATHFRMSVPTFKDRWLYKNAQGAWMNRSQPCPFLDLQTNQCTVYAFRPADCAGFPHLTKPGMADYLHVHKQNISFCPATFKLVEKLMSVVGDRCYWFVVVAGAAGLHNIGL